MPSQWRKATGLDVTWMVALAQRNYESEISDIWQPEPIAMARNLTQAIVDQFYQTGRAEVWVTEDLQSFTWCVRGERVPWSDDEMVTVKMASVELDMPVRERIQRVRSMMVIWENFAVSQGVGIICSTSVRPIQGGFLRLHQAAGYTVRGSVAWRRLSKHTGQQSTNDSGQHADH